jgi:predicted transcriptional regulator of viral defense system
MNFIEFRRKMFDLACFNINQVYAWQPDFNRDNLVRWTNRGLIIRLKQGYYTFPEYKGKADYPFYFANRIYRPSYISLHTALSFYGMIPEAVVQITSVTSLKTASFSNSFGEYSYQTEKEELMFGYDLKPMEDGLTLMFARPEKALLDLLYLYPFYDSKQELEELRLDGNYLNEDLSRDILQEYTSRFENKALENRVQRLIITYGL